MACNEISRAEFDKVKADNAELKKDAAIWRSLLVISEVGVGVAGTAMAVTGNFGPFGESNDSLLRAGALVGSLTIGADGYRRGRSIVNMLND